MRFHTHHRGLRAAAVVLVLVVTGCTGSDSAESVDEPTGTVANSDPSSTNTSAVIVTSIDAATTTPGGEAAGTTTEATSSTTQAEAPGDEVFRIAPEGTDPFSMRFGLDGVWKRSHLPGEFQVITGPVSEAADVYLYGTVFQRPGIDDTVFFNSGDGDQELLVASDNQTLDLLGVRYEDDEAFVVYQRRTSTFNPETTSETLRAYNMGTGEVTELAVTGGWESGTSFSHVNGDRAAAVWFAEAFFGVTITDITTGNIVAEGGQDCFIGEPAPGCNYFEEAVAVGDDVLGFGPVFDADLEKVGYALYRYDTATDTEEVVASWPWGDEVLYEPQGMYTQNGLIVISIQDEAGQPLPALVVDDLTGDNWTAPTPGFLRPMTLS